MGGGSRESERPKESFRDRQRSYRSYSSNNRRSSGCKYRAEDSFSRDDDYGYEDYGERKYRGHNEYHNYEYRERDKRSRSRSSERDSRNYDYNKNYDRYEDRDRQSTFKEKKEEPNNTLMIRNLPPHITDKDVSLEISKFGLFPKDIRLMKNKETGQSRGFAFIEFAALEQAIQLKELTKGCILIENEHECSLHFSFPKETHQVDKLALKNDWCCPKCGINNFKRRDECFKCGANKEEFDLNEITNQKIQQPTNVLMLRNLSSSTTEEKILTVLGMLTAMPIKSIRITQDEVDRHKNYCTVELHSVYEATQLSSVITSMSDGFIIDKCNVTLSYGNRLETSSVTNPSIASQNAAMAALAAAQWKNLDDSSSTKKTTIGSEENNLGSVNINGIEYTKYSAPNYNSFVPDPTSGFYYDSSTGFFYDSKSQYFYNSQTQKYMYYDTVNQIYVVVDSNGQATTTTDDAAPAPATPAKTDASKKIPESCAKPDKAQIAKKIAKDMEKWAKTLNQKKEISKATSQIQLPSSDANEMPTADAAFYSLEKQMSISEPSVSCNLVKDPFEIIKEEEERLTDLSRMACLLCKRQFNSSELLTKHQQLSELHKTNLSVLRQTLLNEEQLEHVEKVEREMAYRDRAQERRSKYGIDDTPEYSKKKYDTKKSELPESVSVPAMPISSDNIGNKMLKAMGWTEGKGLGKSNQGISNIIEVERRQSGLGFGNTSVQQLPPSSSSKSYKDAVRRTALLRFKQLNDE